MSWRWGHVIIVSHVIGHTSWPVVIKIVVIVLTSWLEVVSRRRRGCLRKIEVVR